jgi:CRP-like cAMP-binding protein
LKSWQGQDHLFQFLTKGDGFGEMAVMDHCSRSASVRAVEDCVAIRMPEANVGQIYPA